MVNKCPQQDRELYGTRHKQWRGCFPSLEKQKEY